MKCFNGTKIIATPDIMAHDVKHLNGMIWNRQVYGYRHSCKHCGIAFYSEKKGARYCSGKCRVAAHRLRNHARKEFGYCQECGQVIKKKATGRERKYCSGKCRQKAYRKDRKSEG